MLWIKDMYLIFRYQSDSRYSKEKISEGELYLRNQNVLQAIFVLGATDEYSILPEHIMNWRNVSGLWSIQHKFLSLIFMIFYLKWFYLVFTRNAANYVYEGIC